MPYLFEIEKGSPLRCFQNFYSGVDAINEYPLFVIEFLDSYSYVIATYLRT